MASDDPGDDFDEFDEDLETRIMVRPAEVKDIRLVDPVTNEPFDLTDPEAPDDLRSDPRDEPLPHAAATPAAPPRPLSDDDELGDDDATVVGLSMAEALELEQMLGLEGPPLIDPLELGDEEVTAVVPSTEEMQTAEPWRRLHPASLYINLLPQTYRTLRGLWPLLLLMLFGGQSSGTAGADLSILLVFFAISISRTVAHFITLRYRLSAGKLEVRSGLLSRRSRVLDPYRIQNMELAQNPLHKLAGLVELRVETAGDSSTEGLLSALKVEEAERLKGALERLARARRVQQGHPALTEADDEELLRTDAVELIAYGLSQRRVGTVALLFAAGMEVLAYLDPYETQQVASEMSTSWLLGVVLLAFAGTWLFSAGQALLRHYGFRLTLRGGDRLVTEEGLITRRSVEIPRGKVQLIRIDEPWLRRQMGYGTMLIETAALGMADGQVRQAEGVVPMAPSESLAALTRSAAPSLVADPWTVKLEPAHPRALYRLVMGQLVRAAMLSGFLIWLLPQPWSFGALVLLPLALPLAWLDWRNQGWLVTPQVVLARRGYLTRRTWVIARSKIQSVHMGQSPLMRWHGIAGVNISVAGSRVRLPDIGLPVGHQVLHDLRATWRPDDAQL
ncbi:MAG: putative membrane protein [Myxococcota bacterium]|jgi:putative membrane protein